MKIVTWNVNGVRAREAQLQEFIEREQPDLLCLQEIKASPDQLPMWLAEVPGYWSYWHGGKGYSGVAVHVRQSLVADRPAFTHPAFDHEHRIAVAELPGFDVASVYVPNGGKDYEAKLRFLQALAAWSAECHARGRRLILCGDMNVALTDRDVHAKELKANAIGQRPDERALMEQVISHGLVDLQRSLHPDDPDLFTWWAPWRNLKQRNIGWRIDMILASRPLANRAVSCEVQREFGSSDHGPLIAVID